MFLFTLKNEVYIWSIGIDQHANVGLTTVLQLAKVILYL